MTGYQLVFSKSNGKFLWVPILEKAYAKAYGSYYALEAGNIDEAIRDLIGAPSFSFDYLQNPKEYEYSEVRMVLAKKVDGGQLEYMQEYSDEDRETNF
jgi:hypothetical protein